jgi:hypothetical protein
LFGFYPAQISQALAFLEQLLSHGRSAGQFSSAPAAGCWPTKIDVSALLGWVICDYRLPPPSHSEVSIFRREFRVVSPEAADRSLALPTATRRARRVAACPRSR